jgi:hypothetical protein
MWLYLPWWIWLSVALMWITTAWNLGEIYLRRRRQDQEDFEAECEALYIALQDEP